MGGHEQHADVAEDDKVHVREALFARFVGGGDVEAAGKNWVSELRNLYVSPIIADALLNAMPEFAPSPAEARTRPQLSRSGQG